MSREDRYSIERVKDKMWLVVDKARQGRAVGRAANEDGARVIASLLVRVRRSAGPVWRTGDTQPA